MTRRPGGKLGRGTSLPYPSLEATQIGVSEGNLRTCEMTSWAPAKLLDHVALPPEHKCGQELYPIESSSFRFRGAVRAIGSAGGEAPYGETYGRCGKDSGKADRATDPT